MNEEARSELAEWMRANLFWGLEPSRAPEAADAVLALPALQRLVEQAAEAARLRETVARVEALHRNDDPRWCVACDFMWPCPTRRALESDGTNG